MFRSSYVPSYGSYAFLTSDFSHHTSKHPSHPHIISLKGRCTGRLTDGRVIRLPSHYPHFFAHTLTLAEEWECLTLKMWGRREGERMSLTWLQPFVYKGLRGVMWGCEGHFWKILFFQSSSSSRSPKPRTPVCAVFPSWVRSLRTCSSKPADCQSDGTDWNASSVCHRSLFLLSHSEDSNLIAPFSLSACVINEHRLHGFHGSINHELWTFNHEPLTMNH